MLWLHTTRIMRTSGGNETRRQRTNGSAEDEGALLFSLEGRRVRRPFQGRRQGRSCGSLPWFTMQRFHYRALQFHDRTVQDLPAEERRTAAVRQRTDYPKAKDGLANCTRFIESIAAHTR
jgi:hypothetical protein